MSQAGWAKSVDQDPTSQNYVSSIYPVIRDRLRAQVNAAGKAEQLQQQDAAESELARAKDKMKRIAVKTAQRTDALDTVFATDTFAGSAPAKVLLRAQFTSYFNSRVLSEVEQFKEGQVHTYTDYLRLTKEAQRELAIRKPAWYGTNNTEAPAASVTFDTMKPRHVHEFRKKLEDHFKSIDQPNRKASDGEILRAYQING